MKIKITLYCPQCQGAKIKKNGKKSYGKQNYFCRECGHQFIGDHALSYRGCHSGLTHKILKMLVRGVGIRDVAEIEGVSIRKVLSVLRKSNCVIRPKQSHYDSIEADEFWRHVGEKTFDLAFFYFSFGYV
jgi:transposase-like protein